MPQVVVGSVKERIGWGRVILGALAMLAYAVVVVMVVAPPWGQGPHDDSVAIVVAISAAFAGIIKAVMNGRDGDD